MMRSIAIEMHQRAGAVGHRFGDLGYDRLIRVRIKYERMRIFHFVGAKSL